MTEKEYEQFFELLGKIINEDGKAWKEKRDALLAEASPDDKTNLDELGGWFQ